MQVKECMVSAPGKAILHGEHAVVHGKVALAVSLNMRTYLWLKSSSTGKVSVNLPNIDTFVSWDLSDLKRLLLPDSSDKEEEVKVSDEGLLRRLREFIGVTDGNLDTRSMATVLFLYMYLSLFGPGDLPSMTATAWSEFPTGAGLGSSAALSVCLSAALLCASGAIPAALKEERDLHTTGSWSQQHMELINSWAFRGETIVHGDPSGVDNAVGTWGGVLRFSSGTTAPLSGAPPSLRVLLTNTKVPRSTRALVARVKDKIDKFPSIMRPVLESVDAISRACEKALSEMSGDEAAAVTGERYDVLEELVDMNQHQLNVMGVGHPALDTLCRLTLARGLHSKLTGAGGGGCGITLLRPETDRSVIQNTVRDLRGAGFDCWETSVGGPGVRQHSPLSVKEAILEGLTCMNPIVSLF